MIVVLTTTSTEKEAEELARKILETKLAACVQILPPMKSLYFWDDKIQTDTESLLLIKTLKENFTQLRAYIAENHTYDTPEIVALETSGVDEKYAKWLLDSVI